MLAVYMYKATLLNYKFILVTVCLLEKHEFEEVTYQYQNGASMGDLY